MRHFSEISRKKKKKKNPPPPSDFSEPVRYANRGLFFFLALHESSLAHIELVIKEEESTLWTSLSKNVYSYGSFSLINFVLGQKNLCICGFEVVKDPSWLSGHKMHRFTHNSESINPILIWNFTQACPGLSWIYEGRYFGHRYFNFSGSYKMMPILINF